MNGNLAKAKDGTANKNHANNLTAESAHIKLVSLGSMA